MAASSNVTSVKTASSSSGSRSEPEDVPDAPARSATQRDHKVGLVDAALRHDDLVVGRAALGRDLDALQLAAYAKLLDVRLRVVDDGALDVGLLRICRTLRRL